MNPRSWEYDDRVEELDTDDDNMHGVGLRQDFGPKRFVSDELRFTGVDMGAGSTRRRRSAADVYTDDPGLSGEDDDDAARSGLVRHGDMQVVYKDKEEWLVERALERIARARALGKANVKLSRAEIDALNRLERQQQQQQHQPPPQPPLPQPSTALAPAPAPRTAPKSKKESPIKRKPVGEVRKKPGAASKATSNSPRGKGAESRRRGHSSSSTSSRDELGGTYAQMPSDVEFQRQLPRPQGYYITAPRHGESSRQGSRTNSNQSLRQQADPQLALYQHPYASQRYASNPDFGYSRRFDSNVPRVAPAYRPDPSEPDWEPRSQSNSSLVNVPVDRLPYQTNISRAPRFDPTNPRYASPQRRVASGPAAIHPHQHFPAQYRSRQDEMFLPGGEPEVMRYLVPSSDPESDSDEAGGGGGVDDDDDDDDDDSDYEEGVQVNVGKRPGGESSVQTRSTTSGTAARRGGRTAASSRGKKGR